MRRLVVLGAVALMACPSEKKAAGPTGPTAPAKLSEKDTAEALAALGWILATRTPAYDLEMSPQEVELVKEGIRDAAAGKELRFVPDQFGDAMDLLVQDRNRARGEVQRQRGQEVMKAALAEPGAVELAGGLVMIPRKEGTGASPTAGQVVVVNYRALLADGTEIESSKKKGKPGEFRVGAMLKCWNEALPTMKVGAAVKLVCPPAMAYGKEGVPATVPPDATVTYEVELLEVKTPSPAGAPTMPPGTPGHP